MAFGRSCLFKSTSSTESRISSLCSMPCSVYLFSMRSSLSSFTIHTIAMALCVLVVVVPQRADLGLFIDLLHLMANVLVLHRHHVKCYHRVRATYSVGLLSSIRYTKQSNKNQGKHLYPVYLYVMQLSTSLHVPLVDMVVTTSLS